MVADADYCHAFIAGGLDFLYPGHKRGSVHLHFVLDRCSSIRPIQTGAINGAPTVG